MTELKFTVDRPTLNTAENHDARLAQLGLRYGATSVYRDRKGTYWTPVINYFSPHWDYGRADIDHNIKRMAEIMKAEGLTYMGKAYDSDIYKSKQRVDLNKVDTFEEICHRHSTNRLVAVNPELPIEIIEGG